MLKRLLWLPLLLRVKSLPQAHTMTLILLITNLVTEYQIKYHLNDYKFGYQLPSQTLIDYQSMDYQLDY